MPCLASSAILRLLLKLIFRLSNFITIQGNKDSHELCNYAPKEKIRVAPNYLSKVFESEDLSLIERDQQAVAFVGAVGFRKQCDKILKIAKEKPQYKFNLYGSVEESFKGEKVPFNVTLHGRVGHEQLVRELKKNSYFIFLSNMSGEGQPNALIEGLSLGLIPITVNRGYIREVVPDVIPIFSGKVDNQAQLLCFFDKITAINITKELVDDFREQRSSKRQLNLLLQLYKEI